MTSKADELRKLADLHAQGILSGKEFEDQKREVLRSHGDQIGQGRRHRASTLGAVGIAIALVIALVVAFGPHSAPSKGAGVVQFQNASASSATHSMPDRGVPGVTYSCLSSGYACTTGGYNAASAENSGWPWAQYGKGNASYNASGPHNCTLYAAFRLQKNGYLNGQKPGWSANARDWAIYASRHGVPVDQTPAVGSIAQWNGTSSNGFGHVAYVESVNSGSITITEDDFYEGTIANIAGGYTATITIRSSSFAWPDNFLHFSDQGGAAPAPGHASSGTNNPGPLPGYSETSGGMAHTWSNYTTANGTQGASVTSSETVGVACKVAGFRVADGNTWWYRIASSPWDGNYYVSADAFYNNGQTSGSLSNTPFVDNKVPDCTPPSKASPSPSPAPTYSETVGGVAHTWTNYSNAGGSEGPSIASNQTVQIACKVTGFRVADGNTWWYRIASSPWDGNYYVSADAFYNNGQTSGSLSNTPFVDNSVPNC